jgi:holliday junction DNA helicase RuvA
MIAHVSGTIVEKVGSSLIIDVQGVGYEVQVAAADFDALNINQPAKLYTYHHIREQTQELYGFSSLAAKRLFEMLIGVQGVGPKAALAILSNGNPEQVRAAIAMSDVAYISKANGIGKRTAERVVVDLKDKVGLPGVTYDNVNLAAPTIQGDDALDALIALGYSLSQAATALESADAKAPAQVRIKHALKTLATA